MIRIGTAGWNVPKLSAASFGSQGSHLERYAGTFTAVEINSSFYRPHRRETYERWARSVPEDFRFAVKVSREATHDSRLVECEPILERFLNAVEGLAMKLSVLLVQLPPSFNFETGVAERFLDWLRLRNKAHIALEPRHATWFEPNANALLRERGIARVAADPACVRAAAEPGGALDLIYYRLHGSPRMYYSSYDDETLANLRQKLMEWRERAESVWCIFDNNATSAATTNALTLMRAV